VVFNIFVMVAMANVLSRSLNKNLIRTKTFQNKDLSAPTDVQCTRRQVTQYFSVGSSPYVPILIGICSGSCFSISVPTNNTFINSLCTSCQETGFVKKYVKFFIGTTNERIIEIQSAIGCKCKTCKPSWI